MVISPKIRYNGVSGFVRAVINAKGKLEVKK